MDKKEVNPWRLRHIAEAIEYIEEFSKGVDKQTLFGDYKVQSALVRQFEIIGEAAKNLTPEFRKKHLEIDWRSVIGMRNVLIHDYFAVNLDVLWDTVRKNIPELKKQIEKILKKL